jgi:hypothetical protein
VTNIHGETIVKLFPLFVLAFVSLGAFANSQKESDTKPADKNDAPTSAITESTKQGVTVRVNQVQIQRIGTEVELVPHIAKFGVDGTKFARTIAISASKKNAGKSSGPISLTLKNGKCLTPMMNGNQKYMSAIANSGSSDGFDFEEVWFELPLDTKFGDVFPIGVRYRCTDTKENVVQFELENIYP